MSRMKKVYQAPIVEIEVYELNMNIAQNCSTIVNAGPGLEGVYNTCSDYSGVFGDDITDGNGTGSGAYNVNFYEITNCDCYYSSGDSQVWTS